MKIKTCFDSFKIKSGEPILVTGASSGIGRALCLLLAKRGCRIAMIARKEENLLKLSNEINSLGGFGLPIACDVSNRETVFMAYNKIEKELGKIYIAFLNAGIGSSVIGQNADSEEIERVMCINFLGVVYWLDYLLPHMQKENKGIIAATSSLASYRGLPGNGSYAASKSALTTLFESYQIDFLATNIRFIIISPYFVASELSGVSDLDINKKRFWISSEEAAKKILSAVEKGKYHIAFPWYFRFFMSIMRILPHFSYRLFWRLAKRGG